MKYVWIMEETYPDQCIMGVFSSLEKAKESLPGLTWEDDEGAWIENHRDHTLTIEQHEVD